MSIIFLVAVGLGCFVAGLGVVVFIFWSAGEGWRYCEPVAKLEPCRKCGRPPTPVADPDGICLRCQCGRADFTWALTLPAATLKWNQANR